MTIELTFENVYQESSEVAVGEIFKTQLAAQFVCKMTVELTFENFY